MRPLRLSAAWALPLDRPPICGAAVLLGADGRIVAVGPEAEVPRPADAEPIGCGSAILLPGLVNAHTHLELEGFEGRALPPAPPLREWILAGRRLKEARAPSEYLEAARDGIRACWAAGVTTVADTGDSGAVVQALSEVGGSGRSEEHTSELP